ncbi:hypothetical protein SASPL_112890 [Salvia splendens]|uniref:Formin-like protein 18 n=1 Tax=Salvia splendens TaxID=180675 RepID=A0A8X9A4M1_SALSN|nr:uncharacterized protein LOC121797775 [Salvia splendens]KAG6428637.1 hypothetical protein SASPL_112890 [Salvia splendens]
MDPCPFVRLTVESLALQLAAATRPSGSGIHPSSTPCYATLKIKNFPSQQAPLPLITAAAPELSSSAAASSFDIGPDALRGLLACSRPVLALKIKVFAGRTGRTCGVTSGKLLGTLQLPVDVAHAQGRACVYHSGWMKLGGGGEARLHVTVRSEPDPRYVFQFGGEPECSPVVFQIQGNIRQPVFSCKFTADRSNRSRSLPTDFNINNNRGWMRRTLSGHRDRVGRERKGWMIIVYDLSGSAVAAASMITPFVPSAGSDRVSRSNPGAWLILRPNGVSISSWKPWGRLEAWRERGATDGLGYKFELVAETGGIPIAQGTMSAKKGGGFCIDDSSKDCALSAMSPVRGFVMGSTVEGEGRVSKPAVQVAAHHVTCMADAALFVALSAAVDLSVDACRLFSHKLRKEFSGESDDLFL